MSPTVRAILLAQAGRYDEAADAFAVAADHLEETTESGSLPGTERAESQPADARAGVGQQAVSRS